MLCLSGFELYSRWVPLLLRLCLMRVIMHRKRRKLERKLRVSKFENDYSQLSPCGHLAITDTPIIRTLAKYRAKINNSSLTEINSRYYGLSLVRTLTRGPYSVRYNESWLYLQYTEQCRLRPGLGLGLGFRVRV